MGLEPARFRGGNPLFNAAGRLASGLFSLAFAAAGIVFIWMVLGSIGSSEVPASWPSQPCTIVATSIAPDMAGGSGFVGDYRYTYSSGGGVMSGTNRMERGSYGELREILERYPVGSVIVGRRDPSDGKVRVSLPEQQASKLGLVLAVVIPLFFVAVGVRGVWGAIRGLPVDLGRDGGSPEGRFGWLIGMAFGAVFFGIGTVACVYLLAVPVVQVGKAKAWKETPCVIEHSRVTSSRGSKGGTTYSAEVLYRYEFGGTVHRSDCLTFAAAGIQGQTRSREYVERMAPGHRTVCFVDPVDPKAAVLDRGDSGVFSAVLIILVFPVAGAGIMIFSWSQRPGKRGI